MKDRAAGGVMGASIGRAPGSARTGIAPLRRMRRDYGAWFSGYTEPPSRTAAMQA